MSLIVLLAESSNPLASLSDAIWWHYQNNAEVVWKCEDLKQELLGEATLIHVVALAHISRETEYRLLYHKLFSELYIIGEIRKMFFVYSNLKRDDYHY